MRIGCFGISANPPHFGHLNTAAEIRLSGLVDQVWLIPSFQHPFSKQDLVCWNDRVNMCRFLENDRIRVSLAECEMTESGNYTSIGKSYTIYTLWYLREKHPSHTFYWCVGSDVVVSGSYLFWHRWDELQKEEMILVMERPGYPMPKEGLPKPFRFAGYSIRDESSTAIRNRVKEGGNIEPFVGQKIAEYIRTKRLYS